MTGVMFIITKHLRFSRFTIEVLMQRLGRLEACTLPADQAAQFIRRTHASVADCEQLHDQLRDQLHGLASTDPYAVAPLVLRFEELQRRITESLTRLNSFEYGIDGTHTP